MKLFDCLVQKRINLRVRSYLFGGEFSWKINSLLCGVVRTLKRKYDANVKERYALTNVIKKTNFAGVLKENIKRFVSLS